MRVDAHVPGVTRYFGQVQRRWTGPDANGLDHDLASGATGKRGPDGKLVEYDAHVPVDAKEAGEEFGFSRKKDKPHGVGAPTDAKEVL